MREWVILDVDFELWIFSVTVFGISSDGCCDNMNGSSFVVPFELCQVNK